LRQSPFLDNVRRLLKFNELSGYVAAEQLEFPSRLCSGEDPGG
jgi:hypothetical protein